MAPALSLKPTLFWNEEKKWRKETTRKESAHKALCDCHVSYRSDRSLFSVFYPSFFGIFMPYVPENV